MPYDLSKRLVIGVASSALFDLTESHGVFLDEGEEGYRTYQERHLDDPLRRGVAFPFISRLLSLNDLRDRSDPVVEVMVLSRNDPDTGLRVMRSVAHHGLDITRSIFTQGRAPYEYMPALNMALFLSAEASDVRAAVAHGQPAGQVISGAYEDDEDSDELRVAFDFDGVLSGDESERVMQEEGLEAFLSHEATNVVTPHHPGLLNRLAASINDIQRLELDKAKVDSEYRPRVRVSIVTARNAPAHERAINSLKEWGLTVNDAFFLGGIDKGAIMSVLKPHIFFDDQRGHVRSTSRHVPSVHIPVGVTNEAQAARPSN